MKISFQSAVFSVASDGSFVATPISVALGQVYLTLFGTGLETAGSSGVQVTVNGVMTPVLYSVPSAYTGGQG